MDNQNGQLNPYNQPQQSMPPLTPANNTPAGVSPSYQQPYQQQAGQSMQQPAYGAQPQVAYTPRANANHNVFRIYYLVYYLAGVLDILLAFRFFFLLIGASTASGFVSLIYTLTNGVAAPFEGIVPTVNSTNGTAV